MRYLLLAQTNVVKPGNQVLNHNQKGELKLING